MKDFVKRWYLVIIVFPIVINIFTNTINCNTIINNPTTTFLIISVILNIILVGEFTIFKNNTQKKGLHKDKKILKNLVMVLNLEKNGKILKVTNHDGDINYNYVADIKKFLLESEKIENYINDNNIRNKLLDFKQAISKYLGYLGQYMTSHAIDDSKVMSIPVELKDTNHELFMERLKRLNQSADKAYEKLEILITYLRKKNIS